jgi:hypothetical protein
VLRRASLADSASAMACYVHIRLAGACMHRASVAMGADEITSKVNKYVM